MRTEGILVRPERPAYVDEAEGRAAALRSELGLGSDAIGDVFELLEHLGLAVVRWPMGEAGPDGAYVRTDEITIVAVNSAKRLGRQRFIACHELGHHLFDGRARIDTDIFASDSIPERRANAFAAYSLMPREGVRRWLDREQRSAPGRSGITAETVVHLARHFGTSYEATLYQLRALGWLNPRVAAALRSEQPERIACRLGYALDEEQRERRRMVLPPDFVRRALQAYAASDISLGRLAELLRIDEATAHRLADEAGAKPAEPSLTDFVEEARRA